MLHGVIINGVNTLSEYGFALAAEYEVGSPEPRVTRVKIPGLNGALNLSLNYMGTPVFEERTISFSLFSAVNDNHLFNLWNKFAARLHGREAQIIFPFDEAHYFTGTIIFGSLSQYNSGLIPVTLTAEPYKYDIVSSSEDWLWDPFSLESGVARNYADLPVDGETVYQIIGSPLPVLPKFIITSNDGTGMTVTIGGTVYELTDGENELAGFILHDELAELTFIGSGTVTVEFRGGMV